MFWLHLSDHWWFFFFDFILKKVITFVWKNMRCRFDNFFQRYRNVLVPIPTLYLGVKKYLKPLLYRIRHEVRLSSRITQAKDSLYSRTCRILRIQPSTLWPCEYPSDISDTHGRSTWKLAPRHLLHLPRRPDHFLQNLRRSPW
jgi:hypothetical protein